MNCNTVMYPLSCNFHYFDCYLCKNNTVIFVLTDLLKNVTKKKKKKKKTQHAVMIPLKIVLVLNSYINIICLRTLWVSVYSQRINPVCTPIMSWV